MISGPFWSPISRGVCSIAHDLWVRVTSRSQMKVLETWSLTYLLRSSCNWALYSLELLSDTFLPFLISRLCHFIQSSSSSLKVLPSQNGPALYWFGHQPGFRPGNWSTSASVRNPHMAGSQTLSSTNWFPTHFCRFLQYTYLFLVSDSEKQTLDGLLSYFAMTQLQHSRISFVLRTAIVCLPYTS